MSNKLPEVTIPKTEVHILPSSYVDQAFNIFVGLPRNYDHTVTDKTYPVLYVLDANGTFGMAIETIRMLQIYEEVPEMIVVGIGYAVRDFVETLGLRGRDLTPTDTNELREPMMGISQRLAVPIEFCGAGGAKNFLQFICEELIPFVHTTYRTNSVDQTLFGHSLGGLFALYTLFHRPSTFHRYIIGSPGLRWDNKVAFTYEAHYAAHNTDLPANAFMSVGLLERSDMITNMQAMAKTLQHRNYPNLKLQTWLFENETHTSVIPATISHGLRAVFR